MYLIFNFHLFDQFFLAAYIFYCTVDDYFIHLLHKNFLHETFYLILLLFNYFLYLLLSHIFLFFLFLFFQIVDLALILKDPVASKDVDPDEEFAGDRWDAEEQKDDEEDPFWK